MYNNKECEMQSRKFGGNIEKWNNSYLTMEISFSCLLPLVPLGTIKTYLRGVIVFILNIV